MTDYFWRLKRPVTRARMTRARDILEATGESDWKDAIGALSDDDLCKFLAALLGRSPEKIEARLTLAGALRVFMDIGEHAEELKALLWPL